MSLIKSEKTEKNVYTIEFSVDKDTFQKAISNAYRKQVGKITVPGFRKGKAPRAVIEKMYGKGFFYEDAINEVLPDAFDAALAESKLHMVGQPEFDIVSVDENGVVLSAKLAVKPTAKIEGYTGIEVEKKVEEVTDEELEREINMVRERNSREIEVTDGVSEMNDVCTIDYEGFVDGVAFEGGKGNDYPLKLGSGNFIPGFEEQVAGHKIGEEFDVNVTFPEEYHAKELAGKAAVFKTVIHAIKHVELPELDDDFAKDVSEFDTMDEYRADVKAKIAKRHEDEADRKFEDAILEVLIEKLVADIPEQMYVAETENYVRDYDNRLRMQGLDLKTYFQYTGMNLDSLREQLRPQAEKQVKLRLALETIAKKEKLKVTKAETEAEIARIAEAYGMEADKVREMVPADSVAEDLKVKKAMDFVKENAIVK
ncbi:MAG: trigger factor [Ruminococcaceae bacterium]|nr:trigger factor [Oscillospiraceae bacterium]